MLTITELDASTWYSSPSATTNGDGSIGNPWQLQVAFTNVGSIIPGDTLYLRAGTYVGGFVSTLGNSTNSHILISAYPGEHVIITDNPNGATLGTTMTTNTSSIVITNSNNWLPASVISINNENCQLSSLTPPNTWIVNRGWGGTTNATHAQGASVIPFDEDMIHHTGTNVWFQNLEVTSTYTTNRVATYAYYPGAGINLLQPGLYNKVIDCIIYNTGHPAIGFWEQGAGGELNGNIEYGSGQYDYTQGFTGTSRGNGVYSQNSSNGVAKIRNCIFFSEFTTGAKVFGETGPVQNFIFDGDICFLNGVDSLEIQSGSTSTTNTMMVNNFLGQSPALIYQSVSNDLEVFTNNIIINGYWTTGDYTNSTYSWNTVFMTPNSTGDGSCPIQDIQTDLTKAQLSTVGWDSNIYYLGGNSSAYQWGFRTSDILNATNSSGGGNLKFSNDSGKSWQDWSGFDAHSVLTNGWPTNYYKLVVQPLDYDANQWHIVVISTSGQTNTTLTLSNYGFNSGDTYVLKDAQNPLVAIASNTYTAGNINLPLNLTNFASISGTVTNFTPEHYNVVSNGLFNAFVLQRYAAPPLNAAIHP